MTPVISTPNAMPHNGALHVFFDDFMLSSAMRHSIHMFPSGCNACVHFQTRHTRLQPLNPICIRGEEIMTQDFNRDSEKGQCTFRCSTR